jgi:hypothetical protein
MRDLPLKYKEDSSCSRPGNSQRLNSHLSFFSTDNGLDGSPLLDADRTFFRHSPNTRRVCSSCSPSATLLSVRQMSSANGS